MQQPRPTQSGSYSYQQGQPPGGMYNPVQNQIGGQPSKDQFGSGFRPPPGQVQNRMPGPPPTSFGHNAPLMNSHPQGSPGNRAMGPPGNRAMGPPQHGSQLNFHPSGGPQYRGPPPPGGRSPSNMDSVSTPGKGGPPTVNQLNFQTNLYGGQSPSNWQGNRNTIGPPPTGGPETTSFGPSQNNVQPSPGGVPQMNLPPTTYGPPMNSSPRQEMNGSGQLHVPPTMHRTASSSSLGGLPGPNYEFHRSLSATSMDGLLLDVTGPSSARSSAAPSPIPGVRYDYLEGGTPFTSAGMQQPPRGPAPVGRMPPPMGGPQGSMPPPSGPMHSSSDPMQPPSGPMPPPLGPVPPPTGPMPPQPGPMPPQPGPMPPPTGPLQIGIQAPPSQNMSIAGRRQYPSQSYLTGPQNLPYQGGQAPAQPPGMMGSGMGAVPPSTPPGNIQQPMMNNLTAGVGKMNLQPNDARPVNLMQERHILPKTPIEAPKPKLSNGNQKTNVSPDLFCCTLTSIPQSQSLLQKSKLPLGVLIHPYKDLSHLPVIQSSVIVRCRSCRTYINPFVNFIDQRRWRCNLCFRVNDLQEEFTFDPVTRTYGDPSRRPEIRSSTIEFIAPSEYMLRPPQPAVYLFLLDVSFSAVQSGILSIFCQVLLDELERLPGDGRTKIGFISYDSTLHFYNMQEGATRPQMMVVSDIDDIFLPLPGDLLVNLNESKELVQDLLNQLPTLFQNNKETQSALGPALQAAYKLLGPTGGRVTVIQSCLPSTGPGALKSREDPNQRSSKNVANLGPATDFYKKMALDFSAQQIGADLFLYSSQYADLATLAGVAKFSAGSLYYFPSLHTKANPVQAERFEKDFRRYLTRKIGFEAVMRIRCTKGLALHTFHGNFFVRSTDLLSLPNVSPDAGYAVQMSIEDTLTDSQTACFQAALLYTSSKGERRIRVHTMCLPITNQLSEVYAGADSQAIVGLLSRMAVDKCQSSSMQDSRDAIVNVCIDSMMGFKDTLPASQTIGTLSIPYSLRLLPLYSLALLKNIAFRLGSSTKLDERVHAMEMFKSQPLGLIMLQVYPSLYAVHNLTDEGSVSEKDVDVPQPALLGLSAEYLSRDGAFLMDRGDMMYLFVQTAISSQFCQDILDCQDYNSIPDDMIELPVLENPTSERLRNFIGWLLGKRATHAPLQVIRENSQKRVLLDVYKRNYM
ncbi:protein transport protein Sec24A-like [Anneissia japonica]|uniref:protein transport protein Sec24A-like n=1 Tax=Anneissia japonica TaxID=1529436 RepID=UPI00142596A4|nr:protein transport protein Sec24A-like [Anneissia japonica]